MHHGTSIPFLNLNSCHFSSFLAMKKPNPNSVSFNEERMIHSFSMKYSQQKNAPYCQVGQQYRVLGLSAPNVPLHLYHWRMISNIGWKWSWGWQTWCSVCHVCFLVIIVVHRRKSYIRLVQKLVVLIFSKKSPLSSFHCILICSTNR